MSELDTCCHLLLKKRCLCLVLYYLKHADFMATPMLSIDAFEILELRVSCQHQEDGTGWWRQDLCAPLLVSLQP